MPQGSAPARPAPRTSCRQGQQGIPAQSAAAVLAPTRASFRNQWAPEAGLEPTANRLTVEGEPLENNALELVPGQSLTTAAEGQPVSNRDLVRLANSVLEQHAPALALAVLDNPANALRPGIQLAKLIAEAGAAEARATS
jgi:hypothetical protein